MGASPDVDVVEGVGVGCDVGVEVEVGDDVDVGVVVDKVEIDVNIVVGCVFSC